MKGSTNVAAAGKTSISAGARRFLCGWWGIRQLELLLRLKVDLEATGGAGICELMGVTRTGEPWAEMTKRSAYPAMLAQQLNTCASLTAELLLKSILEGKEGKQAGGHDLIALYNILGQEAKQKLCQEYQCLAKMSQKRGMEALEGLPSTLSWLNRRFVEYRYMERKASRRDWIGIDEIEANHWWSAVLAVKALEHGAFKWCGMLDEVEEIKGLPRSIMLRDRKGWTQDKRSRDTARKAAIETWMDRALGKDVKRTPGGIRPSPVWDGKST